MAACGYIHHCTTGSSRGEVIIHLFYCDSWTSGFPLVLKSITLVCVCSGLLLKKLDKKLERTLLHSYRKVWCFSCLLGKFLKIVSRYIHPFPKRTQIIYYLFLFSTFVLFCELKFITISFLDIHLFPSDMPIHSLFTAVLKISVIFWKYHDILDKLENSIGFESILYFILF